MLVDLKKSFSNQVTNGVTSQQELDVITPAVTGYVYVVWTRLPEIAPEGFNEMVRVLNSQVQVPGYTLATVDSPMGFSGTGKAYSASTIESDTTFTLSFQEQINLPVLNAVKKWVFDIRVLNSGLSNVKDFCSRNISGDCLVIFTKPVMYSADNLDNIIEEAILFTHSIPTTVPYDALNSNKEGADKIQYDVPFRFKAQLRNQAVTDLAKTKLQWVMRNSDYLNITLSK